MENIELTEDSLRSLIGNKKEFDGLDPKLFEDVFVRGLLTNRYVTGYGKKKIGALSKGIRKINAGDASLRDIVTELKAISEEERL